MTHFLKAIAVLFLLTSCAQLTAPGARSVDIPSPTMADKRENAINDKPDSVLYLPLGSDVLVPERMAGESMPDVMVGPFELRSETLAGALQLILADYEIPMAFETDEGLNRTITVTNLKGPLGQVVNRVCGLADLYCQFEDGVLTIKETQVFTVSVPPIGGDNDIMDSLATGIAAITGSTPIVESGTRTLIYQATNRTSKMAERYLQRLRANTALVVFEVYIWEVSLDSGNATGINWDGLAKFGRFSSGVSIPGSFSGLNAAEGVSIGLPTKGVVNLAAGDVVEFLSEYGAVKTISQPQITVMSGGTATLRVADTQAYVASLTRTTDDGDVSISTETDTVDTGFTMVIASKWDNATVYSDIDIELQEVSNIETFTFGEDNSVGLPITIERELQTQVRVRPGDSLLIAGLVRENDQVNKSGPGFSNVLVPTSQNAIVTNRELVFLLKPRVIVYTDEKELLQKKENSSAVMMQAIDKKLFNPSVQKQLIDKIMTEGVESYNADQKAALNPPQDVKQDVKVEIKTEIIAPEPDLELVPEPEPEPEPDLTPSTMPKDIPLNLLNPAQ